MTVVSRPRPAATNADLEYDFRYGETDLLESSANHAAQITFILGITVVLAAAVGVFGLMMLTTDLFFPISSDDSPIILPTTTARPTLNVATVTIGPPTSTLPPSPLPTFTPSITPTRGPCVQYIPQGGNLIMAILNCGHRSQDVVPTVLALNNLSDANTVRVGQEILIPWPTHTPDPNALPTSSPAAEGSGQSSGAAQDMLIVDESIVAFAPTTTPTLPAGVKWHYVQPNENLIGIAVQYSADVKTLSELNREVDFARCDFGETYGGPECIVQLFQGQAIRVPAPTPIPTLSPTPDPNATATPTPTATVNVPSAISPTDRAFFYGEDLITLRWIASGTLLDGEVYRVDVRDSTSNMSYVAYTPELSFTIPLEWQGTTQPRHEYEWTVSIADNNSPENTRYQTERYTFVWQGVTESE